MTGSILKQEPNTWKVSYKSWTKHKQISDLACHPIFHHLSPFNCCWHISFCGLIKRITLKICVLCFVLINTKIAFLWTFYVFGWLIHWLKAHWFTATASKDMGVLIEKTPAQQLIEKRLLCWMNGYRFIWLKKHSLILLFCVSAFAGEAKWKGRKDNLCWERGR